MDNPRTYKWEVESTYTGAFTSVYKEANDDTTHTPQWWMASPRFSTFVPFLSVKNNCQRVVDGERVSERDDSEQRVDLQLCLLSTKGTQHICHHLIFCQLFTLLSFFADHYSLFLQDPVKETHLVLGPKNVVSMSCDMKSLYSTSWLSTFGWDLSGNDILCKMG